MYEPVQQNICVDRNQCFLVGRAIDGISYAMKFLSPDLDQQTVKSKVGRGFLAYPGHHWPGMENLAPEPGSVTLTTLHTKLKDLPPHTKLKQVLSFSSKKG